ncbi:hypothetical protein [Candidatus Clostridium radicumherbarum]|uniref:Uncharacterized protein n=1 Tax=Candidatus Clostridium radicumherbarum TaxID=3381662 RepID=A0ABW8TUV9_9CLOT
MGASRFIARGGILTAIGVLMLYLSTISPTSKVYILGAASCLIPISVLLTNIRNSFIVYIATSLISFLMLGFKGSVIAYIIFFGLYGFIKYYIERLRNIPLEIILKLVYFNISIGILFYLYKLFFAGLLKINLPFYEVVIMLQFVFIIFDYALTLFIDYISKHLVKLKL